MSDPGGTKVVFIKKKAKGHGHHGGAWKVAYADFVTAMMALFIVLWLLTQSDQKSKEAIADYFRTGKLPGGALVIGAPGGSNPPTAVTVFPNAAAAANVAVENRELSALAKQVQDLLTADKESKGAGQQGGGDLSKHVKVRMVNEGALIELVEGGDNFLFNVASSELKPGAVDILKDLAPLLAKIKNRIEIHGHTDARPFGQGSKKTNWELSFERADQARRVFESNGIEKGKILSVLAHADTALYNPDNPLAPENRRLSILVVRASAERTRTGVSTKPAGATPAPGTEAPAEDGTTGEKPAGEKPAEKSAGEQPAEELPPDLRPPEDEAPVNDKPAKSGKSEKAPAKKE
ncbi:MAG: flagellar motor protein MotB [Polyangiales bacterium]